MGDMGDWGGLYPVYIHPTSFWIHWGWGEGGGVEGARNTYILYNVHIRTINTYCILIHIIYSYNIICKLKSMLVKISM